MSSTFPLNGAARLLMIDDNPSNLKLLGQYLSGHGYDVYVANDGKNGLELSQRIIPDLILLDLIMPGMDGFEVFRTLQENRTTKIIPVMFLTAKDENEAVVEGLKLGAVDYITRPYCREILLARVNTHLQIAKLTRNLQNTVNEKTMELHKANSNLRKLARDLVIARDHEKQQMAANLESGTIETLHEVQRQMNNLIDKPSLLEASSNFSQAAQNLAQVIAELQLMQSELSQSKSSPANHPDPTPHASLLTKREKDVLLLLAEGYTSKEAGGVLSLSIKTVQTHRANIREKLKITSTAGLIKFAIREGLISID